MSLVRAEVASRPLLAKLSARHRAFVRALAADPLSNAARAYRAAGFQANTPQTCAAAASRLLTRVDIQLALAALKAEMRAAVEEQVTADDIVAQLVRIGFSDVRRFFDREPDAEAGDAQRRLEPWELDRDEAAALHSVEFEREETRFIGEGEDRRRVTESVVKLKLHDKLPALVALARIKGMFVDKVEHNGKLTLEHVMAEVNKLQAEKRKALESQNAIEGRVVAHG